MPQLTMDYFILPVNKFNTFEIAEVASTTLTGLRPVLEFVEFFRNYYKLQMHFKKVFSSDI